MFWIVTSMSFGELVTLTSHWNRRKQEVAQEHINISNYGVYLDVAEGNVLNYKIKALS